MIKELKIIKFLEKKKLKEMAKRQTKKTNQPNKKTLSQYAIPINLEREDKKTRPSHKKKTAFLPRNADWL